MRPANRIMGIVALLSVLTLVPPSLNFHAGGKMGCTFQNLAMAAGEVYKSEEGGEKEPIVVPDPMEKLNRAFFTLNDKLYFWFLKPVSQVYGAFIPQGVRISIRNAFHNFAMPIRVINCIFQGKGEATGTELARFVINSTLGIGGMFDFASTQYNLSPHDEDFGQTLGYYGMKPVIYINWPLFGPSSLRDSIGLVADTFSNPIYWLSPEYYISVAIKGGKEINATSLRIGEYEDFKKSALDPYVSLRDAYLQYRDDEIKH